MRIPVDVGAQVIGFLAEVRRNQVQRLIIGLCIGKRARLDELTLLYQFNRKPGLPRGSKRLESLRRLLVDDVDDSKPGSDSRTRASSAPPPSPSR